MIINHIMRTSKILTDLCFTKWKIKTKNTFVRVVYSALVVKMCWQEICLSINGTQSVKLEKGKIEFKNYFKQILVPFKIYAGFESNLDGVEIYEGSYSKKYRDDVPCNFAYKVVCIDDKFTMQTVVFRGENAAYEFSKAILKEYEYCKKVMKKYFNKNLIMSEKEEEQFQLSNVCWICKKAHW